ncbi:MAG TPA: helix-turn-helix domain-containing protein [Verrucomicrobiae bacterium]|nr:helix-turn-helix domain-containing protein [Verrucomicrobiae bacterium]
MDANGKSKQGRDAGANGARLWKVRDVADYARCSPRTVGNLMVAGMPRIKLGRLVRFDPGAVMEWMRDRWR